MRLTKAQAFRATLVALLAVCLLYQSIWIFSRTTTAKIYSYGTTRSGSVRRGLYDVSWMSATYKVGGETFDDTYLREGYDVSNPYFEVRYLTFSPDISRANTFVSNWGPLIMAYIVLALITSIAFMRKDIIADKAVFVAQAKRPFIRVLNNRLEDYEQQDVDIQSPTESEKALRRELDAEANKDPIAEIYACQYKFNPNAIAIFVGYIILFFFSFYLLLNGALTYTTGLPLGAFLLFVPLYIQNTNNPKYKAKIPDEGSLTFSLKGVQIGDDFYALENIDAADRWSTGRQWA